jgi:hypothetical protein
MLAQNFLLPVDLDVSNEEYAALINVLGRLERGEIDDKHFNMGRIWDEIDECGCFAGHVAQFMQRSPVGYAAPIDSGPRARELRNLYFPPRIKPWGYITREEATAALRNFLTTGKCSWEEILGQ